MLYLWQVDEEVDGLLDLWGLLADVTEKALELGGRVEGLLAFVALVTPRIRKGAIGASAHDEPISKPKIAVGTVALRHFLLRCSILIVNPEENFLSDLGVPFSTGPSEIVKANIEPLIHLCMDLIVKVTDLLGGLLLLHRLHLSRSTVLVSPADVEHV